MAIIEGHDSFGTKIPPRVRAANLSLKKRKPDR
jgi:hypothetical protein